MQAENLVEYRIIREEMLELKGCVTTYVGWVFGGAGAGFLAIGYAARDLPSHRVLIAFSSLSVAAVISLILLILVYKFISHNRYAGYCKLLTQERYQLSKDGTLKPGRPILAWEVCMDRLREADFRNKGVMEYAAQMQVVWSVSGEDVVSAADQLTGPRPKKDGGNALKGLWIVIKALFGNVTSTSWAFPVYVISLFAVLVWAYAVLATYILLAGDARPDAHQIVVFSCLVGALAYLWYRFCQRVYNLMEGSRSVHSFCWKFLFVRRKFLEELGLKTGYAIVGARLLRLRGE